MEEFRNTASIAGQIGHPDKGWYGMAKAALINATKIYGKTFRSTWYNCKLCCS
ncbi:MAG: hypothetical protein R2837_07835 [Aliarcobacter sp.]